MNSRSTHTMFSSKHARPVPLLDSDFSSEDEILAPTNKRLSYSSLVSCQPLTRYHKLIMTFVCTVTFAQSLQLYLPLLLNTHLGCDMGMSVADRSLLAISYPLSHFIAPLLSAVLTRYSIKKTLGVTLSVALLLILSTIFCRTVNWMVTLRCLAGMLVIPESTLTQLWAHVYPQSYHKRCRMIISCCSAEGLAISVVLLMTHTSDIRFIIAVTSMTFILPVMLSFWVVETPLMVLRNGKYSQIMRSIETVFKGPMINSLRLQEIDFSDDSASNSWNPAYMFKEKRNKRNVLIVGGLRTIQGFILATILCSFHSLLNESGSTSCFLDVPENCTTAHQGPVYVSKMWYKELGSVAACSILGTYLLPFLPFKYEILSLSFTGIVSYSLLSACLFNSTGRTVLLCVVIATHTSLNSTVSHLASTVSVSIAGECLSGLVFTLSMVLAKVLCDETKFGGLVLSAVLMGVVFVSGWLVRVPPTKDKCNQMVGDEQDEPLMEELQMELEIVHDEVDRQVDMESC